MEDVKADLRYENTTIKPVTTNLDLEHSQIEKNDFMNQTTLAMVVTEKYIDLKDNAKVITDKDLDYEDEDELDEIIDSLIYNWLTMAHNDSIYPSCLMDQNSKALLFKFLFHYKNFMNTEKFEKYSLSKNI